LARIWARKLWPISSVRAAQKITSANEAAKSIPHSDMPAWMNTG